jgi:hypothetical protein
MPLKLELRIFARSLPLIMTVLPPPTKVAPSIVTSSALMLIAVAPSGRRYVPPYSRIDLPTLIPLV